MTVEKRAELFLKDMEEKINSDIGFNKRVVIANEIYKKYIEPIENTTDESIFKTLTADEFLSEYDSFFCLEDDVANFDRNVKDNIDDNDYRIEELKEIGMTPYEIYQNNNFSGQKYFNDSLIFRFFDFIAFDKDRLNDDYKEVVDYEIKEYYFIY